MAEKVLSMAEAIRRYVPDGSSVALGLALEPLIPFAAGHELIRQQRRDLTLIGPISDILFDQLIGAGCVGRVKAAWVGNVSEGLGYNYRRATEQGIPRGLEVEDYSNYSVGLALLAAALGVPYIPMRSLLGSDIARDHPAIRPAPSPLDGTPTLLVPALQPDVAIVHVQRADAEGRAHVWGGLGVCEEAALAARGVIYTAEEIVPSEVILSDPNRVLAPEMKTLAVVHAPGGAHPSPVQGYYNRDHAAFAEYHERSRTAEDFAEWLREWVMGQPDRASYLAHLGDERWRSLRAREQRLAAPVDYGY
ncbi:MAG: 3-oxoadipate CoA-transferase subunit A [Ktedonobacterales bacterium]|jgi:glutaconate CoA-transferase subunit A|nr:MAG: 3-oxoadipate CoA-transferase subunit A [Ktedonobacterales bacterium]